MKAFRRLCIAVITAFLLLTAVLNLFLVGAKNSNEGIYRIEAKRLADEIAETGNYDLEKYPHITGVFKADDGELYNSDEHYLIIEAGGGFLKRYHQEARCEICAPACHGGNGACHSEI